MLLEITNLHNDMILSTLSMSSHGFVLFFVSPKGLIPWRCIPYFKPMINPLTSRRGTLLPTILDIFPLLNRKNLFHLDFLFNLDEKC